MIYKNLGKGTTPTLIALLNEESESKKVLIVFWHGIGDVLMFYPLFCALVVLYPKHEFTLGLIPGVGQPELFPEAKEIAEEDFEKDHDLTFVIDFDMVEGSSDLTKAVLCEQVEIGKIPKLIFPQFIPIEHRSNKLVGVHFQGTCLPNATNPDSKLANQIWQDIISAGYIPIDLHFEHTFHNPINESFEWVTRSCRDLTPSLNTLTSLIQQCHCTIAVASGPFVISLANDAERTIYLEKGHSVDCYVTGFNNVIDLNKYDSEKLKTMLNSIPERH